MDLYDLVIKGIVEDQIKKLCTAPKSKFRLMHEHCPPYSHSIVGDYDALTDVESRIKDIRKRSKQGNYVIYDDKGQRVAIDLDQNELLLRFAQSTLTHSLDDIN